MPNIITFLSHLRNEVERRKKNSGTLQMIKGGNGKGKGRTKGVGRDGRKIITISMADYISFEFDLIPRDKISNLLLLNLTF